MKGMNGAQRPVSVVNTVYRAVSYTHLDRIVVMCRGRVTGEVARKDFSQETLMYLAAGGDGIIGQ